MSVILLILVFGRESMVVGPFAGLKECQTVLEMRSRDLDNSFAKMNRGVGFLMDGKMVVRKDITLQCKFDDRPVPQLKGAQG